MSEVPKPAQLDTIELAGFDPNHTGDELADGGLDGEDHGGQPSQAGLSDFHDAMLNMHLPQLAGRDSRASPTAHWRDDQMEEDEY